VIKLSAVVIAFNEERCIEKCLKSVAPVADDIVVVDSFSTDATPSLCRAFRARLFQRAFEGHIEQKNFALDLAEHSFVISLDADEALSPELQDSILKAKAGWKAGAYAMNRRNFYCGKWIRRCGWYPDRKVRLWDRRRGRWGGVNPHDRVIMEKGSRLAFLKGDILHDTYGSPGEHLAQARSFAGIAARSLRQRGRVRNALSMLLDPPFRFLRAYLFKGGFLEGRAGWRISLVSAYEVFLKYRSAMKGAP